MWADVCEKSTSVKYWDSFGQMSKSLKRHSDTERGGVAWSNHLNAQLQHLSQFLLEIPVICHRHFVVESMRRRDGERGGWKDRNVQTDGNVQGEERGRIFKEGKMRSEWVYMGGFQLCFLFSFAFEWQGHRHWTGSDITQRMQTEITNLEAVWGSQSWAAPHLIYTHKHHTHKRAPTQRFFSVHFMPCTALRLLYRVLAVCV